MFIKHSLLQQLRLPICLLKKYCTKPKRAQRVQRESANGNEFPAKLLNKKHKIPDHLYFANSTVANQFMQYVEPHLAESNCDTVLEINPGLAHFTRHLLDRENQFRKILLFETLEHFMSRLYEMHSLYPERVKVQNGDFINLWKLAYYDKMDSGSRITDILQDVPKKPYTDEINMIVFGAVGSYIFFKYLINSVVFQTSLFNYGRCEMYLAVPPPIFIHLTCSSDIGYLLYRSTSMLFQIFFEYRFIATLLREDFVPPQAEYRKTKGSKLSKVKTINSEYVYLIKIVPRRNLFDLCASEDLPALWYFIKQCLVSRRNRVIPSLEKWVPGCGPRLIVNRNKFKPVELLFPKESSSKLPPFSQPCTTMSNSDYYPNIDIHTQFGDLTPSQMLTLFTQFRQWPEYSESTFVASLENALSKMEAPTDENIDGVNITEEDDISTENVNDKKEPSDLSSKLTARKTPRLVN